MKESSPAPLPPGIHHNCGLVGVEARLGSVELGTMMPGLKALQHRGQEGAGMAFVQQRTSNHGTMVFEKGEGKLEAALPDEMLEVLAQMGPASRMIGHLRYGTSGDRSLENVQPFGIEATHEDCEDMIIAHNGTAYPQYDGEDAELMSDTQKVAMLFEQRGGFSEKNARAILGDLDGAYNFLMLTKTALYAARDPHALHPLHYGVTHDGKVMVASEITALTQMLDVDSYQEIGEFPRGALVRLEKGGYQTIWTDPRKDLYPRASCSFEEGYLKSYKNEETAKYRHEWGRRVGQRLREKGVAPASRIVPVPASGVSYARGMMDAMDGTQVQYDEQHMLRKLEPSDRTFITPEYEREAAIKGKYILDSEKIAGQDVVLVDDSIVRGNTAKRLVRSMLECRAATVHLVSGVPPIADPCYLGIDFATHDELIYNQLQGDSMPIEEYEKTLSLWLCEDENGAVNEQWIGRVQVTYQTEDDYKAVLGEEWCYHCIDGELPVGVEVPVEIKSQRNPTI